MMTLWMGAALALADEADVIEAARGDSRAVEYDGAVLTEIVAAYDRDGNGTINKASELQAIPCTVWRALDDSVRAGWAGTPLRTVYGFNRNNRDLIWVGSALGVDEKLRRAADRRIERTCGL